MARTIKEIQGEMTARMKQERPGLSASAVAEWRLWTYVVAAAIHAFELLFDLFRSEVDELTDKITPGTLRWYAEMCYRFQNGHELLFDNQTAMLYYAEDDPAARIVKVVAISENDNKLLIKVAKLDAEGRIVPIVDELHNFIGYIDSIKFAGVETDVVSTTADRIRYAMQVYYDPAVPETTVRAGVEEALAAFKTSLSFDAMFYAQRLVDAVMAASGVVTVDLSSIERKGHSNPDYVPVEVMSELESGYFEYAGDCSAVFTSIKAGRHES